MLDSLPARRDGERVAPTADGQLAVQHVKALISRSWTCSGGPAAMLVSNRLRAPPADLLADAIQAMAGHQPADQPSRYQQRRDVLTANGFELTLGTDLAAGTAGGGLIVGWKAGLIRGFRGRRGAPSCRSSPHR